MTGFPQDAFKVRGGIPIEPPCILRLYTRSWPIHSIARTLKITPAKASALITVARKNNAK